VTSTLVDPEISRSKFRRELKLWRANPVHRERGWLLLDCDEEALIIEFAFLARVSISSGAAPIPVISSAIRLSYENYDLWPPSLTFVDAFTRAPATNPHVRAFMALPDGPRDVLIDAHPVTGLPFLCVAGNREYHSHPQHTGDSWLLHRPLGEGSMSTICDRVWRYMARNVVGLSVQMQALPGWPLRAQLHIVLAQGHIDENHGIAQSDSSAARVDSP
jgi:hypothetical protein